MSRIWLPLTTLQLHITHGLQLPSFTALRHTHSHPPLHQSHSCHQSLINPDCFTTPAPHSHTHTHISSTLPCTHREVLFCPGWHSEPFPCILFPCVYLDCLYTLTVCCLPFDPACLSISSLSATCPDLCIAPVADSALPTWHLLLPLTLACLTLPCCSLKLHLDLNATDSSCYSLPHPVCSLSALDFSLSWIIPLPCCFGLCLHLACTISCLWIPRLPHPLDYVCRRLTHACLWITLSSCLCYTCCCSSRPMPVLWPRLWIKLCRWICTSLISFVL